MVWRGEEAIKEIQFHHLIDPRPRRTFLSFSREDLGFCRRFVE